MMNNINIFEKIFNFDNNGLIGDKERAKKLSFIDKIIIPAGVLIICLIAMLAVGMFESKYGIPGLL